MLPSASVICARPLVGAYIRWRLYGNIRRCNWFVFVDADQVNSCSNQDDGGRGHPACPNRNAALFTFLESGPLGVFFFCFLYYCLEFLVPLLIGKSRRSVFALDP